MDVETKSVASHATECTVTVSMRDQDNHSDCGSESSHDDVSMTSVNVPKQIKEFWIEKNFNQRVCSKFIRVSGGDRCGCGHTEEAHLPEAFFNNIYTGEVWQWYKHTKTLPTNTFGQIDFQGACHANRAEYVRLDFMTNPQSVLALLCCHWQLELPKLLISVHGGIANFELQPKLKRAFNRGLIKAANTTGAWIITAGTNTGVMHHVGQALAEKSIKSRKKHIVAIGIAPWGVIHNREDLVGHDCEVDYHAAAHPRNNTAVLNGSHNYFLLADNGTEGKYGADFVLRKKLERFISQHRINGVGEKSGKNHGVPIVCVVLEGGSNTIRTVLDYLTDDPPVPVVVCDGSGRAADLLAFTHKYSNEDGSVPSPIKSQLITTIKRLFSYNTDQAEKLYYELIMCVKKKELMTIFRLGDQNQDIDLPILTALLKSHNTRAPQQLALALAWDRADVARTHIFTYGQEWPEGALEQAMLDALVHDKVDFVDLLLEKGVNVQKFLTINNLEELYNTKVGVTSTLQMILRDVRPKRPNKNRASRITLIEIGEVIERLMGGAFRARYCRRKFRNIYLLHKTKDSQLNNLGSRLDLDEEPFPYPFSDLMVWCVLLKRQKMAKFMWRRDEEALAKAIIACKLYKALAREAAGEPLMSDDVAADLLQYAGEFQKLAVEILDHCYKQNDEKANQLLTYELKTWSNQTCMSLAYSANMRDLMANPCCQNLISDMWMGALRTNRHSTIKVIAGILIPPSIIYLDFKTKEELQLMPQTTEKHIEELESDEESEEENQQLTFINKMTGEQVQMNGAGNPDLRRRHTDRPSIIASTIAAWRRQSRLGRRPSQPAEDFRGADNPVNLINWQPAVEINMATDKLNESPIMGTSLLDGLMRQHRELKISKKFSMFYAAPVTKYWMHTLAYILFLSIYTHLVLVEMEKWPPSWTECFVLSYIFVHVIEVVREIIVSEPVKVSQKLGVFFNDKWNLADVCSIVIFWIGVTLRFQNDEYYFLTGRVFYILKIVFCYIRIFELFLVSPILGPYVNIVGKLLMNMIVFLSILCVVLMSFGVARQSIRNPYPETSWQLLRDVVMEPYFMLYGELYAESIDPPCGPGTDIPNCWPGRWIVPILMFAYLLFSIVLLLNLLIAVFNETYRRTSVYSREIWMFQRYRLTHEYEMKPLLPPPFLIISIIYLIVKTVIRRCGGKPKIRDYGLKLFLSDGEVRKLHDFEEDCVEDYFTNMNIKFDSSTEERIRTSSLRVESIMLRMEDLKQKENALKLTMQTLDGRVSSLEEIARQNMELSHQLYNLCLSRSPDHASGTASDMFSDEAPPCDRVRAISGDKQRRISLPRSASAVSDKRSSLLRRRKMDKLKPLKSCDPSGRLADTSRLFVDTAENSVAQSITSSGGLESILEHQRGAEIPGRSLQPAAAGDQPGIPFTASLPVPQGNPSDSSRESSPRPGSILSIPSPRMHDEHSHVQQELLTVPFTPLFASLKSEYTTVCDGIDTSCQVTSLESSPSSSSFNNRFLFGANVEHISPDEFYHGSVSPEKEFLQNEKKNLTQAEEHETKVIGSTLRSRIRQISIDESNSMSDIAQLIISDLNVASPFNMSEENVEAANETITDECTTTHPESSLTCISE